MCDMKYINKQVINYQDSIFIHNSLTGAQFFIQLFMTVNRCPLIFKPISCIHAYIQYVLVLILHRTVNELDINSTVLINIIFT